MMDPNLYNLPRPRGIYKDAVEDGLLDINQAFEFIRTGEPELLEAAYGPKLGQPMEFLADSIRSFIVAEPGHELVAVDYSSIQGVLAAWFAGEDWKLKAMAEIIADPKNVPDLYRRAAAKILNLPIEVVTKKHWARQAVGKTSELALQFEGSISALTSRAANYGMTRRTLHKLYPGVWAQTSDAIKENGEKRYLAALKSRRKQESDVLTRDAWLACYAIVHGWRGSNPAIKASWTTLETAIRNAVREPGKIVTTLRGVQYLVKNGHLWCRLPSGRCIAYGSPRLRDQVWARVKLADGSFSEAEVMDGDEARSLARKGEAKIEGETSPKVTVLGTEKGKLVRYALYGGLCMQNLALGSERDILVHGMKNCEDAGWPVIYHVYDEAVVEVPRGTLTWQTMAKEMLKLPPWAKELPLGALGFQAKRYRKD